ncbi:MAG: hypothetical protein FWC76_01625 [Defluviitaleaceae bacterium]|nr:hypothetical protein [Defluviitaleaceae bacterium]
MNPLLKPMKTLAVISIALHGAAIFAAAVLVLLRYPIATYIYGYQGFARDVPLSSPFIVIPIVAIFVLHGVLIVLYQKALQDNASLKTVSILSLVFVIIIIPFIDGVLPFFTMHFHARYGTDFLVVQSILQGMINFAMVFRWLGSAALLISASMALYYMYYCKTQQKIGGCDGE